MKFGSKGYTPFSQIEEIDAVLQAQKKELGCEVDYRLIDAKTVYIKRGETAQRVIADVNVFNKDSNFIAKITIKQLYDIEVFKKSQKEPLKFGIVLRANENTSLNAILVAKEGLAFYDELKEDIYQELYKAMIAQKYFIFLREFNRLSVQIDTFINALKRNVHKEKTLLDVCIGVTPQSGKNGRIVFYFELPPQSGEKFEPVCCSKAVRKDDLIFEYFKPIEGVLGRDMKGNWVQAPGNEKPNPIKLKAGIRPREFDESIKYYAQKDGFFKEIERYTYLVNEDLMVSKANTNLQESDQAANMVNIDGSTATNSNIETDIAVISTHRGFVKANTVVIDVLEKGRIEAKVVYINSSVGGNIKADYIYIKELRSYNEIFFKYSLVIDNILGDHNLLELNPAMFSFAKRDRVEYVMLSEQIKIKIRHLRKTLDELYSYLLMSQNKIGKIKQTQQNNQPLPKNLQSIVDQYDRALERYSQSLEEYQDIAQLFFNTESKLKSINEAALEAKLIVREECQGVETLVNFRVYSGNREEVLKTIIGNENPIKMIEVIRDEDFFRLRENDQFGEELLEWIEKYKLEQK